jgi:phosphoribosylaminoimidazolecarboxamide formyltransferase/IMP cyclohydrolase
MKEAQSEIALRAGLVQATRYGENPQQGQSGLYDLHTDDPLAIPNFEVAAGSTPSYNNYGDIDRMLQTITHVAAGFDRNFDNVPNIAIGAKHGNACGASIGADRTKAIEGMLRGDSRAIFGGSVMMNFPVGKPEAETLMHYDIDKGKRLLDVVVAPAFTDEALDILNRKNGKLRALGNVALNNLTEESLDSRLRLRQVRGGFLAQQNYDFVLDIDSEDVDKHSTNLLANRARDIVLAWAIGSTSNSNTITLVKNHKLIGNGAGRQDRVSAAELAIKTAEDAGHSAKDAVAYSDSFFPFPDGPQKLIDAGVSAILTSSGSVKDQEVFSSIIEAGVDLWTVPDKAGRGFYAH